MVFIKPIQLEDRQVVGVTPLNTRLPLPVPLGQLVGRAELQRGLGSGDAGGSAEMVCCLYSRWLNIRSRGHEWPERRWWCHTCRRNRAQIPR